MLLYQVAIRIYFVAIKVASMFNTNAKKWLVGRENWEVELSEKLHHVSKSIWIHCASLGEFEQGRSIIERIRKENPNAFIVLTFFSPSGYEIRKNYTGVNHVCYLPIDTKVNAKKFIAIIKPTVVFFIKYEFWFNYLEELFKLKAKVYFTSVIFRKNHFLLKKYAENLLLKLKRVEHLFLQDKESFITLESKGFTNISISGDTRFDRVVELSNQEFTDSVVSEFVNSKQVLIAGSTWPQDEKVLSDSISFLQANQIKLIIAPHEIHESHISEIEKIFSVFEVIRYSTAKTLNFSKADVLIIDCIGKLMSMYSYANYVYVGGGFGKGIHNTLEPACFGLPILFGPNYYKFNEAKIMIDKGSAFCISNSKKLEKVLQTLIHEPEKIATIKQVNRTFVHENSGATEKIWNHIKTDILNT